MNARNQMLTCFRNFRGSLLGVSKTANKPMRFKPAINDKGDLFVNVFIGKSTKVYAAKPLDEWATWADEHVSALGPA